MPRDEIVTAVDNKDDDKKSDDIVLDLSELSFDDVNEIDTGVTSGADSSDWDPINVDGDEEEKKCAGAGSAAASKEGSPAACGVKQSK